ncbi:hypothetical protein AAAC51_06335 [Priestia megaterium]
MKIVIDMNTDNDAFQEPFKDEETARVLSSLAGKIKAGYYPSKLHDLNGNSIPVSYIDNK